MPAQPLFAAYQGWPVVTAARMREIDRFSTEKLGLKVIDLMENAGRAVAAETAAFLASLGRRARRAKVAVCCGRGANGGDGLVAARVLKEGGADAAVFICAANGSYPEPVAVNLARAKALGVPVAPAEDEAALEAGLKGADVILDGLLGTGSSGAPTGVTRRVIEAIARARKPVVAIDVPSGIDPDTGSHGGVCVRAALTLALGLPKQGLVAPRARLFVGELKVLDIGFPKDILVP